MARRLPASTPSPGLGPAAAAAAIEALPRVLEIVADGYRTRSNIRAAVTAMSAAHDLRMMNVDEIRSLLRDHIHDMSYEVRQACFIRILELTHPSLYQLPWDRLLPPGRG